jgi:hydroxymethylbilane synthase
MIDQIKILTRESLLARIQGKIVGDRIHSVFPKLKIIYHTSKTLGDLDQNLDLKSSESRGLFTGDISRQIASGASDIAVHSWKDYPIVNESKTNIVGTLSRADSRDMLFIKKDSVKKKLFRNAICNDFIS